MSYFLIALSFTLLISSNVFAAQSRQVNYPYMGIKFTVPTNWSGQEQKNNYLIQSKNKSGFILLFENNAKNMRQLEYDANKGLFTKNIQLTKSGPFEKPATKEKYKQRLGAEFHGYINGTPAKAYIIGLINPFGTGITITAVATTNNYSTDYKKIATQIANSMVFSPPKIATETVKWQHRLLNAQLTYVKTSGNNEDSNSSRKAYTFCNNHTFYYTYNTRSSFGSNSASGYMRSKNTDHGRWKITTGSQGKTLLHLRFDSGYTSIYPLEDRKGKTYMNNLPYLYAKAGRCHN